MQNSPLALWHLFTRGFPPGEGTTGRELAPPPVSWINMCRLRKERDIFCSSIKSWERSDWAPWLVKFSLWQVVHLTKKKKDEEEELVLESQLLQLKDCDKLLLLRQNLRWRSACPSASCYMQMLDSILYQCYITCLWTRPSQYKDRDQAAERETQ